MQATDVIIIGGGPGGSTAGAFLALHGVPCMIFEREEYPRFHIGESLLPASMPIYKETGFFATLASGKYIEKYGARFVDYGNDDEIYFGFAEGLNREIPMAFEVERSKFDKDILDHARKLGVDVHQPERVKDVEFHTDHVTVTTARGSYQAKFLLDCTGRDAFLGKRLKMRQAHKDLNNFAVFAHYTGITRYPDRSEGDITIGLLPERSWSWIIPFKGETTSVGVVASSSLLPAGLDLGQYLEERLSASPRVQRMMQNAERISEISTIANYSHHTETFVGDRWICGGDAAAFLDPIFSSGVHVATMSGKLAALTLVEALKTGVTLRENTLNTRYESTVRKGVERFHNLINLFYHGRFVEQMKKTLQRENMRAGFTSAVAGDMWNDDNFLFNKGVL
jgi:flavin-dependent dehydrogenase